MSKAFPIDAAQMVGVFMESVFYGKNRFTCSLVRKRFLSDIGIYLVSFFSCLRVLLWTEGWFKRFNMINKKMLLAALLMFLFATMDVAFHLRHNLEAFVYFNADPIETFDQTSNWINVMKMACYVAQTFVGDTILIFRCWIVYGKKWFIVVVPALLWIGTTVCGVMTIYLEASVDSTTGKLLNSSSLVPFIISMLCLTLATNVLTTSLIVRRIWGIRKSLKHRSTVVAGSPLTNVMIVLVESGLMYTTSIVILFILYMASNNGQYGVSNAVVQIIGITFNLIITSVDRGDATQPTSGIGRHSHFTAPHESQGGHGGGGGHSGGVPLHMINIHTSVCRMPPDSQLTPSKTRSSDVENSSASISKNEWAGE